MSAARRFATSFPFAWPSVACFHSTRPGFVRIGDLLPDLAVLVENCPGNKVNLAKELKMGKGLIIGTPGAFSAYSSYIQIPLLIFHLLYALSSEPFSLSAIPWMRARESGFTWPKSNYRLFGV